MADYIMDLRKAVGHRPLLQVGAGVIVVDAAGRVLLQRRSDNGCRDYSGELTPQEGEVDELRFFDADRLPEHISPPSRRPLTQWLAAGSR